ncbi:mechanosensitive ion channel family protein [Psychroflexus maritimus]|uniref:Mechanosensitive ion channel n=1 Tax=Psychroflexus maritimus TaxID=2714865 RepID=A0A967AJW0_9FLAO|nr:mechanosensitive ion channel domain-containing protein [Psychroflexus maritimus]NGZ89714.1 mechanosensitive ion channel [Psychroflexus maritimus]
MEEININYITETIEHFGRQIITFLPGVVAAIVTLIVGLWLANVLTKRVRVILERRKVDPTIRGFVINLISVVLKVLVFVIVITELGVETTSLAALIGAAGLAIGLSLQGSLSNFAGGVLILLMKPFRVDDFIEAQGVSGTIKEISIFYTHLITINNQRIVIPNGQLSNNKVINFSSEDTRRNNMIIGISYDSNIGVARETLLKIVNEHDKILSEPAPEVFVNELADSSVNLSLRFWTKTDDFWPTHFFVLEQAKLQLEQAGCSIPFPQRDVHLYKTE